MDTPDTHKTCIDIDLDWLKNELKGLTKEERCIILEEYSKLVQDYGVGMREYKEFIKVFERLED